MIQVTTQNNFPVITGYQIVLRQIQPSDLELLRQWRNSDFVSSQMISQDIISVEQQQAWYKNLAHHNDQRHWLIEYKSQPIGAINLKAVTKGDTVDTAKVLEPGLYIGASEYQGNIVAFAPTLAICDYCFNTLQLDKLVACVKKSNDGAIRYNEQIGYQVTKEGDFVELCLRKEDYLRHSKGLRALLSRTRKRN